MDANKIAVLSNQLGGLDELENVIQVPAELLQKAINGEPLSRFEREDIDAGILKLTSGGGSSDLAIEAGINIEQTNALADAMDLTERITHSQDVSTKYRQLVAIEALSQDDIENNWTIFGNLTTRQAEQILDNALNYKESNVDRIVRNLEKTRVAESKRLVIAMQLDSDGMTREEARKLLDTVPLATWQKTKILQGVEDAPDLREMFAAYEADGGDIFGDMQDSEFWSWFREMFY
jgi:hypothetical protein